MLVTSGGVSVGPHDLVRRIEAELGVEEVFWRVAVKPGQAGLVRRPRLDAGLRSAREPGLVARRLRAVRPAGRARAPGRAPTRCPVSSRGGSRAPSDGTPRRDELVRRARRRRGRRVVLEPLTGQESHMIVRAAEADALVLVPRGEGELAAGDRCVPLTRRRVALATSADAVHARGDAAPRADARPAARRRGSDAIAKKRGWQAWSATTSRPCELQDGEVVWRRRCVARDRVEERPVRQLERHAVAGAAALDVRERREVGRPVAGDVDELALAGHVRAAGSGPGPSSACRASVPLTRTMFRPSRGTWIRPIAWPRVARRAGTRAACASLSVRAVSARPARLRAATAGLAGWYSSRSAAGRSCCGELVLLPVRVRER